MACQLHPGWANGNGQLYNPDLLVSNQNCKKVMRWKLNITLGILHSLCLYRGRQTSKSIPRYLMIQSE